MKLYRVIFRLRTLLHIGQGKSGNVQFTRPYVTGRVMWGALTARLTRDQHQGSGPVTNSAKYEKVGRCVHNELAFTYFYPTVKNGDHADVDLWPWEKESAFRRRFLSSYASTALSYPRQSALEGSLHEVECITPYTQDQDTKQQAQPVYLLGYIFAKDDTNLEWKSALNRLQIGGEQGYGWGRIELENISELTDPEIFGMYTVDRSSWPPVLELTKEQTVLAHTCVPDSASKIEGDVEPLVGRETKINGNGKGGFGTILSQARICWIPGSSVTGDARIRIGHYGIWEYDM